MPRIIIREFKGKLDNRIDVRGIIASISGFTKPAIGQAKEYIGQKVILFFGREDLESIFNQQNPFELLLDEKFKYLLMKKEVIFK